jgi:hypothetical protein
LEGRFLGTSGQNIDDLDKYSEAEDRLDFMERTLLWRHLAPTAPDTLGPFATACSYPVKFSHLQHNVMKCRSFLLLFFLVLYLSNVHVVYASRMLSFYR